MVVTVPLTFGSTAAIAPVAMSYATMLLRVTAAWPGEPIEVNVPTDHTCVPHWRVIRVSGVVPAFVRKGVLGAGVADTVAVAPRITAASFATVTVRDMIETVRGG